MCGSNSRLVRTCRFTNAAITVLFALFFLLGPAVIEIAELQDPGLRQPGIPQSAWRLHSTLSVRYERWARDRLASSRAAGLSTSNISGTEWPLFGSVFYLWATESLQEAWEKNPAAASVAPKDRAHGAIEAAAALVLDPKQAAWVQTHWGTNYLSRENVFYRMLLIAALTSHAHLTGSREHLELLRTQTDGLAQELDASRWGLLDDYPFECYPGDVLTATAMIRRADRILGTDHSAFVQREIRGFEGGRLDSLGLVPYSAEATSGHPGIGRGCGNSYVCLFSPEIWPEQARRWYDIHDRYFWQETWTCAGFREFARGTSQGDWYFDVDAGPVLKGFGCAACAFGTGAARVNGRFDHAYPLAAQMIVTSWPLPGGTLLLPRLLSNAADAPLLGEAAVLFNLTCQPAEGMVVKKGGSLPGFVYIWLVLQIGSGFVIFLLSIRSHLQWRREGDSMVFLMMRQQFACWVILMLMAAVFLIFGKLLLFFLCILIAQFFPRGRRRRVLQSDVK
jgi:hypothetical protein